MRKLKLKPEDLSVIPFVTGDEGLTRGTVAGYNSRVNCTGAVTALGADNNCYPINPTAGPEPSEETYEYYCTLGQTC